MTGHNQIVLQMTKYQCYYFSKGKNIDASDVLTVLRDMGIELTEREEETLWDTLPIHGELSKGPL